jgi:DnaJ-class molecular chaperone
VSNSEVNGKTTFVVCPACGGQPRIKPCEVCGGSKMVPERTAWEFQYGYDADTAASRSIS